jgi:hypothetical protein
MQSFFRSGTQATMTTMGLDTLPPEQTTLGAGMDTLARNLGNTAGVPLISAYVIHKSCRIDQNDAKSLDRDGPRAAMARCNERTHAGQPLDEARVRSGDVENRLIGGRRSRGLSR